MGVKRLELHIKKVTIVVSAEKRRGCGRIMTLVSLQNVI